MRRIIQDSYQPPCSHPWYSQTLSPHSLNHAASYRKALGGCPKFCFKKRTLRQTPEIACHSNHLFISDGSPHPATPWLPLELPSVFNLSKPNGKFLLKWKFHLITLMFLYLTGICICNLTVSFISLAYLKILDINITTRVLKGVPVCNGICS